MFSDYIKTIPQYILPQHTVTYLAGLLAKNEIKWIKDSFIRWFIKIFSVDMSEALIEDPSVYPNFNEFFIRRLKPEIRPLASSEIVSPVDGCISEIGVIEEGTLIQAKKKFYTVSDLLACSPEEAHSFQKGSFVTLYLSPKDYHRIHMPIDARLVSMTYIPGALFSVNPSTARTVPNLFARNKRVVLYFETKIGLMAMVLVGATIVGSIGVSWHKEELYGNNKQSFDYTHLKDERLFCKGEEIGYFKLGSTVLLLFADGSKINWKEGFKANTTLRFGEELAHLNF